MDKQKITIPQLKVKKEAGQKFRMVTAYDYLMASVVDQTPIETILVGDSLGMVVLGYDSTVPVTMEDMIHHLRPVVKGAPHTLIVGDMPFGSYNGTEAEAVANGTRLMKEGGADCVKLEGGEAFAPVVKALVRAGIPVIGHIGLTPQTVSQLGGFKVQGKDAEAAQQLVDDAMALEAAGASALVIECVPAPLGKVITEKLSIPTIGIGAGPDCDGQVLVAQDLLGMFDRFVPKFVKQYANVNKIMVEALEQYASEVAAGTFPGPDHCFGMKEEVLKKLY
ncbi:MAG: 3-methyl-2-oxobutanoate hydroxymethyltransferase [Sporomusaceae bacterium]|nr:3-methyl-2-oxobutanoate hydroxymethyltransferase [Sporomusaceae bacterium]